MDRLFYPLILLPLFFIGSSDSSAIKSSNNSVKGIKIPQDIEKVKNVPFAAGLSSSIWPIAKTKNDRWNEVAYKKTDGSYNGNSSRAFGSLRSGGDRYHVGIDLYCDDGDPCIACESGVIIGTQGFLNITKALLLQTDTGVVLLYGEIRNNSWEEFNISKGVRVKKGQPLCRIGKNQTGSAMLHFETYKKGTTKNYSWYVGQNPNSSILNPTKYLLRCLENSKNREILV